MIYSNSNAPKTAALQAKIQCALDISDFSFILQTQIQSFIMLFFFSVKRKCFATGHWKSFVDTF